MHLSEVSRWPLRAPLRVPFSYQSCGPCCPNRADPWNSYKIGSGLLQHPIKSSQVVCNFYAFALFCALLRPFALFCALLRTCICALLHTFALICVFLRPTAFRTTAFGDCRSQHNWRHCFVHEMHKRRAKLNRGAMLAHSARTSAWASAPMSAHCFLQQQYTTKHLQPQGTHKGGRSLREGMFLPSGRLLRGTSLKKPEAPKAKNFLQLLRVTSLGSSSKHAVAWPLLCVSRAMRTGLSHTHTQIHTLCQVGLHQSLCVQ